MIINKDTIVHKKNKAEKIAKLVTTEFEMITDIIMYL